MGCLTQGMLSPATSPWTTKSHLAVALGAYQRSASEGLGSVITMPRILAIGPDGYLQQRPAPEFETLRGAMRMFPGPVGETFVADG
jgi:hypothetical protein